MLLFREGDGNGWMGCIERDTLFAGVPRLDNDGEWAVDGTFEDEAIALGDIRDCGEMCESSRRCRCGERVGSFAMSLEAELELFSARLPAGEARRSLSR